MADRAISALPTATTLTASDLFVLSQSNQAKNTTWQVIIGYLTAALDGHGGIQSIAKTGTNVLVDTYTITYADSTTTTFTVTNGKQISSITQYWAVSSSNTTVPSSWSTTRQEMTTENKYLWSYFRYTYNDGTTSDTTKSVVGVYGDTGQNWYVWIRYAGQQPTSDSDIGTTPDNWIGIYSGTSATAPTSYTSYDWFEIKGEKGDTGDAATITTQNVSYQVSNSGTVAPSGSWTTTIPTVPQGSFLWTRTQFAFNDGTTVTAYSVSRYGIDGTGAVSTVNGVSPDGSGNVALTATNIPMSDNQSIQTHVADAEDDIDALNTSLNNAILQSAAFAITANGTASHSLAGLTADHAVVNWGMFSDSGLTTPIPENAPTCDIEIATASGSWSVTIANFSSSFYLRPTFGLKQN